MEDDHPAIGGIVQVVLKVHYLIDSFGTYEEFKFFFQSRIFSSWHIA